MLCKKKSEYIEKMKILFELLAGITYFWHENWHEFPQGQEWKRNRLIFIQWGNLPQIAQ